MRQVPLFEEFRPGEDLLLLALLACQVSPQLEPGPERLHLLLGLADRGVSGTTYLDPGGFAGVLFLEAEPVGALALRCAADLDIEPAAVIRGVFNMLSIFRAYQPGPDKFVVQ